MYKIIEGEFEHWDSDIQAVQNYSVSLSSENIEVYLEGYGDQMYCLRIELGLNNNIPRVVIWADKEIEEPTHIISLENAKDN